MDVVGPESSSSSVIAKTGVFFCCGLCFLGCEFSRRCGGRRLPRRISEAPLRVTRSCLGCDVVRSHVAFAPSVDTGTLRHGSGDRYSSSDHCCDVSSYDACQRALAPPRESRKTLWLNRSIYRRVSPRQVLGQRFLQRRLRGLLLEDKLKMLLDHRGLFFRKRLRFSELEQSLKPVTELIRCHRYLTEILEPHRLRAGRRKWARAARK